MNEKSSIQYLEEFAEKKEIPCHTSRVSRNYIFIQNERYASTKYVVFDLCKFCSGLYFIFFDSFSSKMGSTNTFCGFFKEFPKSDNNIKIVRRDWFDKLSFKKRFIAGDQYIDKHVTIFSELSRVDHIFLNKNIIKEFVDLSEQIKPIHIKVETDSYSVVKNLNNKNLISIQTNRWILDYTDLEIFLSKGIKLMNNITTPH
jgi:hypothetical protein